MTDVKVIKKKKVSDKVVELLKLGNILPIPTEGKENQEFTFKNWTMKEEKKISVMKNSGNTMGQFVSNIFGLMLDTICGVNFSDMKKEEKILLLNQLELPNMIYMWIYLRYEVLGSLMRMDVGCPHCGKMNKDKAFTLDTMDITVKNPGFDSVVDYKLFKPIKFNDEVVTTIKVKITKWAAMEKVKSDVSGNEGMMKELIFNDSIVGINDSEGCIPGLEKVTESLSKRDIESLSEFISNLNGGPTLALKDTCTFCSKEYHKMLNWGYDDFFGASSLPVR